MKNLLLFVVAVSGLAVAIYCLSGNSYDEKSAKEAYKISVEEIKSNWAENKDGIKALLVQLEKLNFDGQIMLQNNEFISIMYNVFGDIKDQNIMLGKDYNDILFLTEEEKDTLVCSFFFEGTKEDKDLSFLLSKMNLSKIELSNIIDDLRDVNCVGVAWDKDVRRVIYLGNPFSGSFEYLTCESNSTLFHRKFYQLENDMYWGFYESGLYCNMPTYIPN